MRGTHYPSLDILYKNDEENVVIDDITKAGFILKMLAVHNAELWTEPATTWTYLDLMLFSLWYCRNPWS